MQNLPIYIYYSEQIRTCERLAAEKQGISADTLMQRAGAAAFKLLQEKEPEARHIAVMCGAGNNAGDGYVVAKLAKQQGLKVDVWNLVDTSLLKGPALAAAKACEAQGVNIQTFSEKTDLSTADVIVDALLGTGIKGELKPAFQQAINTINKAKKPVLAIDLPSGLNADTGAIHGMAVQATYTITFLALKPGLLTGYGSEFCKELHFDNLDVPASIFDEVKPAAKRLSQNQFQHFLTPRARHAHKGDFGHVLVVGGDYGMEGAVRMAAEAAARVGAGLVSVATRPQHAYAIAAVRPELMCHGINDSHDLDHLISRATVIAVGPGIGQSSWAQSLLDKVLASDLPLIVDADALNLLAKNPCARNNWILTPHPGEAARLLNCKTADIEQDRLAAVRALQQKFSGVCVLKGNGSLIFAGGDVPAICAAGNPGMASGGMGDVLTGVIAGLLAQLKSQKIAAELGVYVHAHAGDVASRLGERGMIATDLMPFLRALVNPKN